MMAYRHLKHSLFLVATAIFLPFAIHAADVNLGEWTSDFDAAKAKADSEHVPMLIFWGNPGCPMCALMKEAFETAEFKTWQAERKIIMLRSEGVMKVKEFVANETKMFPYMAVYWHKEDGSTIKPLFTGRNGMMPVKKGTLARQLIDSVELYISGYQQDDTDFVLTDGEGSHLEVVAGETSWIDVPLKRTAVDTVSNCLVATDGTFAKTNTVDWALGVTSQVVRVIFDVPVSTNVGLSLISAKGIEIATSGATMRTNLLATISYPLFVGEKTAATLDYGEWTMDLDVAKAKVAAETGNAYTLVNVGGDLWCPNCQQIAEYIYSTDEFAEWAKSKKVALVSIDQPRAGTQQASLLTYVEDSKGVSGAFYRSSKMIDDAAAQAVIARNEQFSFRDYLLPSTGASRIANPTVLIFNKAGEIVGRVNPRRDSVEGGSENYVLDETLARLNELLAMADAGLTGETRKDSSTTTLALVFDGVENQLSLSVNDNAAIYRVGDLKVGLNSFVAAAVDDAAADAAATLELFTTTNSYAQRVVLASGTNSLDYACTAATSNVFLRVAMYGDARKVSYALEGDTTTTLGVSATFTRTPGEVAFTTASQKWLETTGVGAVSVARTGGVSGVAAVRVTVDEAATTAEAGRYTFAATNLVWQEGETGVKTISVPLRVNNVYEGSQMLTLKLEALENNEATIGEEDTQADEIYDTKDPAFGAMTFDWTFWVGFEKEFVEPIYNIESNKSVMFNRESGKLPSGVTIKYDKKTTNAVIRVKATAASESTARYAVSEVRTVLDKATTISGMATTFNVRVLDPKTAKGEDGEPLNSFVGVAYKNVELPVVAETEEAGDLLAGILTVNVTAKNRVTAKFSGTSRRVVSFSGSWQELDEQSGEATTVLTAKTGAVLTLALSREGVFSGAIENVDNLMGEDLTVLETPVPDTELLAAYSGSYTATFPIVMSDSASDDDAADGLGAAFAGTGALTLSADGATFKKQGRIRYSGITPDGRTISGMATLAPDAYEDLKTGNTYGVLPIFNRTTKGIFAALVLVRKDGWSEYSEDPYNANLNPQVILAHPGLTPYVMQFDGEDLGSFTAVECYGGVNLPDATLEKILTERQGDVHEFVADMNADVLGASEVNGAIEALPEATVTNKGDALTVKNDDATLKLTLRYTKKTGLLTGTVPFLFESGRKASGIFRGVLLPGWHDCHCGDLGYDVIERPLASGTVTFSDKVDGKSVKRTFALDLVAEE